MYVKVWVDCPYLKRRQTRVLYIGDLHAVGHPLKYVLELFCSLLNRPVCEFFEVIAIEWRREWYKNPASHVMDSEGNDTGLRVAS